MNPYKYLVLLKGEDKTEEIVSYDISDLDYIYIHYKNTEKLSGYKYLKKDFEFYKNPIEIDIQKYKITLDQGFAYNIVKLIKFDNHYRIFFENNTSIVTSANNVNIVENTDTKLVSANKFEYFKDISKIVSVKTEEGIGLLTKEYEKINFIEKYTALYKYLNPNYGIKKDLNKNLDKLIFPFGANKSQFKAVRNAMSNQISIVEGPPGTGKTQTILNIIANIINNGQTVAIVSNNNAATDNVYEKLEKYNLNYLCARLGKKENKDEFIKNQKEKYPNFSKELLEKEIIENELINLNQNISEIFDIQNDLAKLKEQLSELKVEHDYFNVYEGKDLNDTLKIRNIAKITSDNIMRLKVEYEDLKTKSFWLRLKSQFIYGIGNNNFYKKSKQEILEYYNKMFYIIKEIELDREIKEKEKRLKILGDNKLESLKSYSIKILNEYLRNKYKEQSERKIFNLNELYINSEEFNREYPIVFSTTYSIKNSLNEDYKYDYIIMDESSQVDLITGVLALSTARNAVIVGDLKQLPNVITSENQNIIEEISKKYDIADNYNYLKNSFLESIKNTVTNAPKTLLREHYRCHPKIIQFCNKKFYDNQLIIMTEDKGEKDILKAYITSEGNHARGHLNQRQIDVIKNEVIPELSDKVELKDIGIISPYRKQGEQIQKTMETDLKIDTVHKFQGREEEAIILTTVDNEISEFVDDPKMLNVAVTRAKKYLRLIVSNNENNKNTNIGDLIRYIQYNNFETTESKTKSIYDLLYKQNRQKRLEYLKDKKRISDFDSENITYNVIDDILKKNKYSNLDIGVHVPIMNILSDAELLNQEEVKFATNSWTHIDFVIFNKMDKRLVLAIEVDGYYFHKEGSKQQENDNIKNNILEKYNIPLIRLSTIGSGEEEILEKKIKEIFK